MPIPIPRLIASSKISCESPPVSHIANPARPASSMNLPFATVSLIYEFSEYPRRAARVTYGMRWRRHRRPSLVKSGCIRRAKSGKVCGQRKMSPLQLRGCQLRTVWLQSSNVWSIPLAGVPSVVRNPPSIRPQKLKIPTMSGFPHSSTPPAAASHLSPAGC
jgi:hypothetical protein